MARGPAHAAAIDPAVGDVGQPHGGPGQRAHGAGAELHAQHAQRRDVGQAGSAAGDFDGRHERHRRRCPRPAWPAAVVAAQAQREPTDHVGQRRAGGHGQQDGQRRRYAIVARQDGRGRRRRPGRRRGSATAGRRPAGRPGPGRPGRWCRPASSGPRSRSAAARSARRPRGPRREVAVFGFHRRSACACSMFVSRRRRGCCARAGWGSPSRTPARRGRNC